MTYNKKWFRQHYIANREKKLEYERWSSRRRLYGLTKEQWLALLATQNGRCAICGTDKAATASGEWCTDHNHQTGKVRGLLCWSCNVFIGRIERAPKNYVDVAVAYIKNDGPICEPSNDNPLPLAALSFGS